MGEERRFRSHFQVVGERRRQRIHDDRRLYRARSPAQCWRSKKNIPQAIGRSRGGLTTKIHALVDALGRGGSSAPRSPPPAFVGTRSGVECHSPDARFYLGLTLETSAPLPLAKHEGL